MKRQVTKVLDEIAEKKYFDIAGSLLASSTLRITTAGEIFALTNIPQDTTDTGRIGDKVRIHNIRFTLSVDLPAIAGIAIPRENFIIRCILFIWKDDSVPTVADILQTEKWTDDSINFPVLSPYNHDLKVKRAILMDEKFVHSWQSGGSLSANTIFNPSGYYEFTKSLKSWTKDNTINYIGGTTNGVNKIGLLLISNAEYNTGVTNRCWDVFFYNRVTYVDY